MTKFTGETTESAIKKGLASLQLNRVDADISVVDEGKKGFLGFGKKDAVVVITPKKELTEVEVDQVVGDVVELTLEEYSKEDIKNDQDKVKEATKDSTEESVVEDTEEDAIHQLGLYLRDITKELGAPASIDVTQSGDKVVYQLDSEKKGQLIGKRGKTLNALQYLAQVYLHHLGKNKISVIVNVGDYRQRREVIMNRMAKQALKKVRESGQPVFLEPMPAFERKQIHSILSKEVDIKTHSEGHEPHRYLVVDLKK